MTAAQYSVRTTQQIQLLPIDPYVVEAIHNSGIESGVCVVFVPHTTAGVTINENADPDVVRDIIMEVNKVIPFDDHYHHREGNSAAHIKSTLVGPSLTLIIEQGRPLLGTWQTIYFCEFDGPRHRDFFVKVISG